KAMVSEGTASIRLGVGGAYSIMDYDAAVEGQHTTGLGVSSVSADGKSLKEWWFGNFYDAPLIVSGTFSGTGWKGKVAAGPMGPFDLSWTTTATGFEMKADFADGAMTESYTRKK